MMKDETGGPAGVMNSTVSARANHRIVMFHDIMRAEFGERVYKVNVDAGFTCPNRDGTVGRGGCIYCNIDAFRPGPVKPKIALETQIENGIRYVAKRYRARRFIVYFQPFTNTHAPVETLERLYRKALSFEDVVGLAIGTRPDAVDPEKIALLEDLARDHWILVEYGLQSIHDRTLRNINRGHDVAAFSRAVAMTAGRGIRIGAHLILGLPGESNAEMLEAADVISGMDPVEFLKLHQLQVVRGTPLADVFARNPFPVFAYAAYVELVCDFLQRLAPRVAIQRVCATAPDDILIAPRWAQSRHHLLRDILEELARRNAYQGCGR